MKIKRKLISFILVLTMILSSSLNVSASDSLPSVTVNKIFQEKKNDTQIHEALLSQTINKQKSNKNEYEKLKDLKKMNENELKTLDFTKDSLKKLEDEMLNELKFRSTLTIEELNWLGYSTDEAKIIKENGNVDSLEAIAISNSSIFATCFTYNTVGSHTYVGGTTYFKVYVGWSWDKKPLVHLNDIAAIGWDDSFTFNSTISASDNKLNVNYTGPTMYVTNTHQLYENAIRTSKVNFPLSLWLGNHPSVHPWAKSGSATVHLSSPNMIRVAKLAFKYGHNTVGGDIGISIPWGLGFTFSGAEYIYTPNEIAHSSKNF